MKYISLPLVFFLTACAQLMHGQTQPVIVKDANKHIMYTTCAGAVEEWASCHHKASKACAGKYSVLNQAEDNRGTSRELTFQCNQ